MKGGVNVGMVIPLTALLSHYPTNTARSKVFSHVSTTMVGIQTIRAHALQSILADEFDMHQVRPRPLTN